MNILRIGFNPVAGILLDETLVKNLSNPKSIPSFNPVAGILLDETLEILG